MKVAKDRPDEGSHRPPPVANLEDASAELSQLRADLALQMKRREEVEAELEKLKKSAIDMMKYVTRLQRTKHDEEIAALKADAKSGRRRSAKQPTEESERRHKETADLEQYIAEQYEALERARRGEPGAFEAGIEARRKSLDLREAQLAGRRRELEEMFQRLREERELRRAEADSEFSSAMSGLPELQKVIVDKDERIKELLRREEDLAFEVGRLRAVELLAMEALGKTPSSEGLRRKIASWDDEIVRLRHALRQSEDELQRTRADFEVKLRNTIALQRIAL